jgi:hypothetical protein
LGCGGFEIRKSAPILEKFRERDVPFDYRRATPRVNDASNRKKDGGVVKNLPGKWELNR